MLFYVVHLDVKSLEVRDASDDALVVDTAVQWVTMGLIVRVYAIAAAIEVIVCDFMQAIVGSILGAVRDKNHKMEIHALSLAFGKEEPVGKPQAGVVSAEVEL